MCLGFCPFDFVSAGRHSLMIFSPYFSMVPCFSCRYGVLPNAETELAHVVREADGSVRHFTSEGVNVQAYGRNELSATDRIWQTRHVESLISLRKGKRCRGRKSEGHPIRLGRRGSNGSL